MLFRSDAVIGDEPIFDEDDDDWLHNNIFFDYQDTSSYDIEVVQALGPETKEHPKHENNMPELNEHVEYIDFIGIDKILHSYISLNFILKELQVDDVLCIYGQISFSIFGQNSRANFLYPEGNDAVQQVLKLLE